MNEQEQKRFSETVDFFKTFGLTDNEAFSYAFTIISNKLMIEAQKEN